MRKTNSQPIELFAYSTSTLIGMQKAHITAAHAGMRYSNMYLM